MEYYNKMHRDNRITGLALAAGLICSAGIALAHTGATGVVKMRMEMMSEIADSMKTIGGMIKGTTGYDAVSAATAARTIRDHAGKISEMFPAGSTEKPSEALPAIWENPGEFMRIANELEASADRLASRSSLAGESSAIKQEFIAVGKTCSACHEKFRLKK